MLCAQCVLFVFSKCMDIHFLHYYYFMIEYQINLKRNDDITICMNQMEYENSGCVRVHCLKYFAIIYLVVVE